MRVDVVCYDPAWPATFETIRVELAEILRDVEVNAIEHVGSTAVPGLAAKPVIDIDVVVSRDQLDKAIRVLEGSGYRHRGDLGVPDRHASHVVGSESAATIGCLARSRSFLVACNAYTLPVLHHPQSPLPALDATWHR